MVSSYIIPIMASLLYYPYYVISLIFSLLWYISYIIPIMVSFLYYTYYGISLILSLL